MSWWPLKRREEDLLRELGAHLDLEAEEQRHRGLAAEEARYAALRTLGNRTSIAEDARMSVVDRVVLRPLPYPDASPLMLSGNAQRPAADPQGPHLLFGFYGLESLRRVRG
jgi:hypothetical protein